LRLGPQNARPGRRSIAALLLGVSKALYPETRPSGVGHDTAGTLGFGELVADANKVLRKTLYVRRAKKKFPFSRENGPCSVAMSNHALLSRRLQHDTPHDEVQRVGPVLMLFVVRPILLK